MDNRVEDKALVNKGNWWRLKRCMEKALNGEKVTIGFIGGSITQGCLSSLPETCYAYLVYKWWQETFPKATFEYVNAGIGGTTSQFGVARVQEDLLAYQPDFVVIEFSVNDEGNSFFEETYEGLVRNILLSNQELAALIINNVYYDSGKSAQEQHNHVGKAYGLPCISVKDSVYQQVLGGEIPVRALTSDDLHPNDLGHLKIAGLVTCFLVTVYKEIDIPEVPLEVGKPITCNAYEKAYRLQNSLVEPSLKGFIADESPKAHLRDLFKKGWYASHKGDAITFKVKGNCIGIQYRKSIHKPTPIAIATIDGDETKATVLDGNFEEDWGDGLYIETIAHHIEDKEHQVEIKLIEASEKDVVPFYLVSIIGSTQI